MTRQYELTYIVDAHLPGEQIDAAIEKISKFLEKNGGRVLNTDRWGKRRLAYEIDRKQYGYYVCIRFEAEVDFIKPLERELKLDDAILRFMTILIPKAAFKEEARVKSLQAEAEETAKSGDEGKKADRPEDVAGDGPGSADAKGEETGDEVEKKGEAN